MSKFELALQVAGDLFTVGSAIVKAVRKKDMTKVDEILKGDLHLTIAKRAADIRAQERFGA